MTEYRIHIRANKEEKKLLTNAADAQGITISDYIKYRVFYNNPEFSQDDAIFEIPSKSMHDFLTMGRLNEIYYMLWDNFCADMDNDEKQEFSTKIRARATQYIAKYGYQKIQIREKEEA